MYVKTNWEDLPNQTTPINASNLNKIENQLEASDNDISNLKGLVVYSNATGSNLDITIDDITGAAYIDIVYSILYNNEYTYFSKRIYDPVGKRIVLDGMIFLTFEYSNNFSITYQISATSISHTGTYGYFNRKYPAGTMNGETNNYDVMKINKVVAYY